MYNEFPFSFSFFLIESFDDVAILCNFVEWNLLKFPK